MSDAWVSRVLSGEIELNVRQFLEIAEKLAVTPASLVPVLPITDDGSPALTFEEFCRKMVKEELAKQLAEKK